MYGLRRPSACFAVLEPSCECWEATVGEEAGVHGLASEPTGPSFRLDMDGISFSHGAAATTVSPVFSLWLTLVLMYIGKSELLVAVCEHCLIFTYPSLSRILGCVSVILSSGFVLCHWL